MKKNDINPNCIEISRIEFGSFNMEYHSWYKHIVKSNKSYFLAIAILADIIRWYKPKITTKNGILKYKQLFAGDKLQKSYNVYAELFNVSKTMAKKAIDHLIKSGYITREFRSVSIKNNGGTLLLHNVMFLEPVPFEIKKITEEENVGLEYIKPNEYIERFLKNKNKTTENNYKLWLLLNRCTNYAVVGKYANGLEYKTFLNTLYWKGVSYYVKYMNDFKCQQCDSKEKLVAHHTNYKHRGYDHLFWDTTLICLCDKCHKKIHSIKK